MRMSRGGVPQTKQISETINKNPGEANKRDSVETGVCFNVSMSSRPDHVDPCPVIPEGMEDTPGRNFIREFMHDISDDRL